MGRNRFASAERYVRPAIVATEPPSVRAARWRFRLVVTVLLLVVAFGLVLLIRALVGGGEGNPGVLGPYGVRITTEAMVPPPLR